MKQYYKATIELILQEDDYFPLHWELSFRETSREKDIEKITKKQVQVEKYKIPYGGLGPVLNDFLFHTINDSEILHAHFKGAI